ncbi:hypothetical protein [Amycolatopsis sp. NPDC059657]|uniref:hypothetical protein n=1 Tax=Amycolatopsis sp. NPDC059657 TaxID=3346899 RepID=UPI00366F03F6
MGSLKWNLAAALASVALSAGCGQDAEPAKPAPAPAGSTAAPTSAPSTSATTSSASPTPTVPPAVADGRNLKACSDGVCEVEVKAGDMIRFGKEVKSTPKTNYVAIVNTSANGIYFQLDGGFGGTFNGTSTLNNAVTIETLYSDAEHAMIKISLAG